MSDQEVIEQAKALQAAIRAHCGLNGPWYAQWTSGFTFLQKHKVITADHIINHHRAIEGQARLGQSQKPWSSVALAGRKAALDYHIGEWRDNDLSAVALPGIDQ